MTDAARGRGSSDAPWSRRIALVPRNASGLVLFATLAGLAFAEGGLMPRSWRLATVALLALAGTGILAQPSLRVARVGRWAVACLAALTAWTAASAAWSSDPVASLLQGERVLVYAAAVTALLVHAERTSSSQLLVGTLAAATVVAVYALGRYLVARPPYDPYEEHLLYQPLGYANALGIVATIGILLSVGLATAPRVDLPRLLLGAPVLVLAPTLYLTSSRASWVCLGLGLAVLFALRGGRAAIAGVLVAIVAAGALAAVIVISRPSATFDRLAGENRPHYWRAALDDYRAHPVLGSGAGTYGDYWLRHRPVLSYTRTAHSLYLQSLAELGPWGLVLVAAALGVPLVALRRRRDPLVAVATAGYVAYLVHTGVDWDWELPAVTLTGLACGAALLVAASRPLESAAPLSPRTRLALLGAMLVLAAVEIARSASGPGTPFGS